MQLDDLDLTDEERQMLMAEGLIMGEDAPLEEGHFEPGPASAGGPLPEPSMPHGDLVGGDIPTGADPIAKGGNLPLSQGAISLLPGSDVPMPTEGPPPDPTAGALALLNGIPTNKMDPTAQRFHDIALNWLPTDDKELKSARAQAQGAAKQLADLRAAADAKAKAFPYLDWGAAMLAGGHPNFMRQLGVATQASNKATADREQAARALGLKEADFLQKDATDQENIAMRKVTTGADLANAAARIQHYANSYGKIPMGALAKRAADLGIDMNTPDGKKAMERMYVMEQAKSDPAVLRVLFENPTISPLSDPKFAELVAKRHMDMDAAKEDAASAKDKRAESREDRAASLAESQLATSELQRKMLTKKIDEASGSGKTLSAPAALQLSENAQTIENIDRTIKLIQANPNAIGAKAYLGKIPGVGSDALNRMDPKGVEVRAALSDIGSAKLHERSGAAVTASEFPRLKPFIPSDTDTAEIAVAKLKNLRAQAEALSAEKAQTLMEAGYRVPPRMFRFSKELMEAQRKADAKAGVADPDEIPAPGSIRMTAPPLGSVTTPPAALVSPASTTEVKRQTADGRTAVFDAKTKKFLRWDE